MTDTTDLRPHIRKHLEAGDKSGGVTYDELVEAIKTQAKLAMPDGRWVYLENWHIEAVLSAIRMVGCGPRGDA